MLGLAVCDDVVAGELETLNGERFRAGDRCQILSSCFIVAGKRPLRSRGWRNATIESVSKGTSVKRCFVVLDNGERGLVSRYGIRKARGKSETR